MQQYNLIKHQNKSQCKLALQRKVKQVLPKLKTARLPKTSLKIKPCNIKPRLCCSTPSLRQHEQLLQAQNRKIQIFGSAIMSVLASFSALLQHQSIQFFPHLTALAYFAYAHYHFYFPWHLPIHGI